MNREKGEGKVRGYGKVEKGEVKRVKGDKFSFRGNSSIFNAEASVLKPWVK